MLAAERAAGAARWVGDEAPLAAVPEGMQQVEICTLSGMRANPWCPTRAHEWLPPDGDAVACSWHHATDEGLLTVWPPEYRGWAAARGLLQDLSGRLVSGRRREDAATGRLAALARPSAPRLEIVSPPAGALYSIDPTLRREFQAVALRAVADAPGEIEWRVDGQAVGRVASAEPLLWPLRPGSHEIAVRDARGRTSTTSIVVR